MSRRLGFLDLPKKIRQLVYQYAGLSGKAVQLNWQKNAIVAITPDYGDEIVESRCWHDANFSIVRREDYHTLEQYWEYDDTSRVTVFSSSYCEKEECFAWSSCFALLLACKTTFLETYQMIYGENRFMLDRSAPKGFRPFFCLGVYAIQALTHLTIRLDGEPSDRIDMSLHWTRTSKLLPMKHYSRYGKQAYKQWMDLITRLRECRIAPGRLNLFLVTSVPDIREAKLVLQPLESLPSLKSCGIWLNEKPIPELQALLEETVKRLISPKEGVDEQEEKTPPFRYLDLPQEIRLRILSFSDLCSSAALEWKLPTSSRKPTQIPDCDCYDDLGYIDEGMHYHDCKRVYKEITHDTENGLEYELNPITHCCSCIVQRWPVAGQECKLKNDPYMCIFRCPYHSSYTAPKTSWKYYCHALFLVSHQVRQDAIPVFFQKRQFVITPINVLPLRFIKYQPTASHLWDPYPLTRTELSLFLAAMSSTALYHIRYLEWLLPARENYLKLQKGAYFDYLDTIELMAQAMTLTNLTLVVNIRATRIRERELEGCDCIFNWPVRDHSDDAFYKTILGPLGRLGEAGLKDCWIYLRLIRTVKNDGCYKYNRDAAEIAWEKKIMGNREYDALSRGKPWMERVGKLVGWHFQDF